MRNNLRYLFGSPLIREFWLVTRNIRSGLLIPGTDEFRFEQIALEVLRELQPEPVVEDCSHIVLDPEDVDQAAR
jgi:hypothetical protein